MQDLMGEQTKLFARRFAADLKNEGNFKEFTGVSYGTSSKIRVIPKLLFSRTIKRVRRHATLH
ncbi:MAG: hypothetical protein IJU76_05975 [Desulfovibrionaceae bacterium]|nr:hypothetical protein [Desulfovibrionaceae bacterium]